MSTILVVSKGGSVSERTTTAKTRSAAAGRLAPRGADGKAAFGRKAAWTVKIGSETHNVELWATDVGRAGSENKYDFPPPVDSALFFGSCVLVGANADDSASIKDITAATWTKVYEKLFGGFEDLVSESPSEDELAELPAEMTTKEGYLKDGFVVDSPVDDKGSSSEDDSEPEAVDSSGDDEDEGKEESEDEHDGCDDGDRNVNAAHQQEPGGSSEDEDSSDDEYESGAGSELDEDEYEEEQ